MLTKDKKPFTYTPGGIDLSEIRSPRMARRIERNANAPGVGDYATAPQPHLPTGPLPPSALAAMQPALPVQVFPPGAPPPPPPPPVNIPPPPPMGPLPTKTVATNEGVFERPDMTKIIPENPMALLRRTSGVNRRSFADDGDFTQARPQLNQVQPNVAARPQVAQAQVQMQQNQQPQPQYTPPQPQQYRPSPPPSREAQAQPQQYRPSPQSPRDAQPEMKTSTAQLGSLYIPPINNVQEPQRNVASPPAPPQRNSQPSPAQSPGSPQSPIATLNKAPRPWQNQKPAQEMPPWAVRQQSPPSPTEQSPPVVQQVSPQVQQTPPARQFPPTFAQPQQQQPVPAATPPARNFPPTYAQQQAAPVSNQTARQPQQQPRAQQQYPGQPTIIGRVIVPVQMDAPPNQNSKNVEAVFVTQPVVLQHPGSRPEGNQQVNQQRVPVQAQPKQQVPVGESRATRIIPIQIEGDPNLQRQESKYSSSGNTPATPGSARTFTRQPSWSSSGPTQSNSFKVIQKMTNTDGEDDEDEETVEHSPKKSHQFQQAPTEQVRKIKLTDGDRELMNKFKQEVYTEDEENPRYRGGHIPSRVFRILDESGLDEENSIHKEVDPRYRGATIPSKAFRLLQSMTDGSNDPASVPRNSPTGSQSPQVRTIPVQIEGEASGKAYVPPSEQTVQEPKKYTGSAIPSRSFKMLQAMTGDTCEGNQANENNENYQYDPSVYWGYNPNYPPPPPPYWHNYWHYYYSQCPTPTSDFSKAESDTETVTNCTCRSTPVQPHCQNDTYASDSETDCVKRTADNPRATPLPFQKHSCQQNLKNAKESRDSDGEFEPTSSNAHHRKTPLPFYGCYSPFYPIPYSSNETDSEGEQNRDTSNRNTPCYTYESDNVECGMYNENQEQYSMYPPYWDPYYYSYYYGYPPMYPPYPFYPPMPSDSDDAVGYSSTDEMACYNSRFMQQGNINGNKTIQNKTPTTNPCPQPQKPARCSTPFDKSNATVKETNKENSSFDKSRLEQQYNGNQNRRPATQPQSAPTQVQNSTRPLIENKEQVEVTNEDTSFAAKLAFYKSIQENSTKPSTGLKNPSQTEATATLFKSNPQSKEISEACTTDSPAKLIEPQTVTKIYEPHSCTSESSGSDTEVDEDDNEDYPTDIANSSYNNLQAIRSVSDINIYYVDDSNCTDDEDNVSEATTTDDCSEYAGEEIIPHQLSVIFEESERSDCSRLDRYTRESSVATDASIETVTFCGHVEDSDEELEAAAKNNNEEIKRKSLARPQSTVPFATPYYGDSLPRSKHSNLEGHQVDESDEELELETAKYLKPAKEITNVLRNRPQSTLPFAVTADDTSPQKQKHNELSRNELAEMTSMYDKTHENTNEKQDKDNTTRDEHWWTISSDNKSEEVECSTTPTSPENLNKDQIKQIHNDVTEITNEQDDLSEDGKIVDSKQAEDVENEKVEDAEDDIDFWEIIGSTEPEIKPMKRLPIYACMPDEVEDTSTPCQQKYDCSDNIIEKREEDKNEEGVNISTENNTHTEKPQEQTYSPESYARFDQAIKNENQLVDTMQEETIYLPSDSADGDECANLEAETSQQTESNSEGAYTNLHVRVSQEYEDKGQQICAYITTSQDQENVDEECNLYEEDTSSTSSDDSSSVCSKVSDYDEDFTQNIPKEATAEEPVDRPFDTKLNDSCNSKADNEESESDQVRLPSIKERIEALQKASRNKSNQNKEDSDSKVCVKNRITVFEDGYLTAPDSGTKAKSLSTKSSVKSFEEMSEDDVDSGVTSDISRHISDNESDFPELRKMTRYQRAATHSRLFKLLQDECDNDSEDEKQEETPVKIQHNVSVTRRNITVEETKKDVDMVMRRESLSLPLYKNNSEPESFSSSGINSPGSPVVNDRLVTELVQSLLRRKKGQMFRNIPLAKLRSAAYRILQEDLDAADLSSDEFSSLLSPMRGSTENSTPAQTPQEFYGNYTEYNQYYDTWREAEYIYEDYDILPSKAFRFIQEQAAINKTGGISGFLARCPRVLSSKNLHKELISVLESHENPSPSPEKSLETKGATSAS